MKSGSTPRWRRAIATATGAVLVAAASVAAGGTASAAEQPVTDGELRWGYKQSFRGYVGNQTAAQPPIGAVPVGQRIIVQAPAAFDEDATPASTTNTATPNETLPYLLPVTGGSAGDVLRVESAGSWEYHFPSHGFDITMGNVVVEVDGDEAVVIADVESVVTADFGTYTKGEYGGEEVEFATSDAVTVTRSGSQISVSLANVVLTAAGSEALPLYPAGDKLDDLTLTASLGGETAATPQISVSRQSGFNPEGVETVTVTGTGFDPAANISTRPPVTPGQSTGVYVVFGKFAADWRPSAGAPSSARTVISQKWAIPEPSKSQVGTAYPSQAPQLVELNPDGTFTAQVEVKTNTEATGHYGIYTYAAGGAAANAAQELYLPVSFAGSEDDDVDVVVTVPETGEEPEPEPGEFTWRVDASGGAVSLGTATPSGDHFAAQGQLAPVLVTDTRADAPSWSVSAQVSNFATSTGASFQGSYLGWTPVVTQAGAGAVAGDAVSSGFVSGSGLAQSRTLASAAAGHELGSAALGAALDLRIPLSTSAGDYTGRLTLTAIN